MTKVLDEIDLRSIPLGRGFTAFGRNEVVGILAASFRPLVVPP
jgi:hypothetical protein